MTVRVLVHTLKQGERVEKQESGPHTGKQRVQVGIQGLEGEEEESGETQAGLVELQVSASPGVWEEEWGTLWCRGGEEGGRAGDGARSEEVGERQGHGHLSLPAQRGRACGGGNTKHQQTDRNKKAKYGDLKIPDDTLQFPIQMNQDRNLPQSRELWSTVPSPKPSTDMKNKMPTSTILQMT